jgi:hypothetical protein
MSALSLETLSIFQHYENPESGSARDISFRTTESRSARDIPFRTTESRSARDIPLGTKQTKGASTDVAFPQEDSTYVVVQVKSGQSLNPTQEAHAYLDYFVGSLNPIGADCVYLIGVEPVRDNTSAPTSVDTRQIADFYNTVKALVNKGEVRKAMGYIYIHINDLLILGRFRECDEILREATGCVASWVMVPEIMISFLVITIAAKKQLRWRRKLYALIENSLTDTLGAERAEKILVGLD